MTPEPDVIEPKRVSIVIVSFNRIDTVRQSLTQLGNDHQVLVVDNGSTDGSYDLDIEFPTVRFIRLPKNFGLTKALNIGIRAAEGTYVLLLHDDAVITGEAVAKLAEYLEEHQEAGAVSPLLLTDTGGSAPQVRDLPSPSASDPEPGPATEATAAAVSGAAIMFRTFFLRALRQIDEHYGNYGSTIELCIQVRRSNRKIVILRDVTATHGQVASPMSKSTLEGDRVAGTAVFLGKHYGFLAGILYRVKKTLAGLLTFRIKVLAGAISGAKIDGSS